MWTFIFISFDNFVSDAVHNLIAEVLRENSIRIDDDEGWPNECEYFIMFVTLNEVVKDLGFIEDVHLAHIIVEISIRNHIALIVMYPHR